jgi:hypothetical protein
LSCERDNHKNWLESKKVSCKIFGNDQFMNSHQFTNNEITKNYRDLDSEDNDHDHEKRSCDDMYLPDSEPTRETELESSCHTNSKVTIRK